MKRRGAFTFAEFQALWREGKLTEESYVWAQGMDDFQPLRTVPGLAESLMTLGAPTSVAAQGGTPRPAMDVTKGSFFYKDKSGVRLGPSVLDTMKIMWDFKEIDENTEVFAEGLMEGFQPVSKVPELHRALATGQAGGPLAGGATGLSAGSRAAAPALPDFPSFDVSLKADGLGPGAGANASEERQKVELAATRSLLEAAKAEIRAKEATIGALHAGGAAGVGAGAGGGGPAAATPRTAVSLAPRGAKSPWTPPPPRPSGDLTESEYDEDDDYQNPGAEAANGVVESANPIYTGGMLGSASSAGAPVVSPQAGSRGLRGASPAKSGRNTVQLRSMQVLEEPEAPQTLSQRIKARQTERGVVEAPSEPPITSLPAFSLGTGAPQARTGGRASPTQATQQSIYGVFKSEMRTLEEEHARCRENLEREYESRRGILNKALLEEDAKLKKVQEQYNRVKGCMDQDLLELEKESRRLAAVEQSLAEARSRVDAEVDVMRLKLEEENEQTKENLKAEQLAMETARETMRKEREAMRREYDKLEAAKQAALREKHLIEEDIVEQRTEVERGRKRVDEDIQEFEAYKLDVERLHNTRSLLLKEEQEEFAKKRAVEVQRLESLQDTAGAEADAAEQRLNEVEKQRSEIEYESAQRSSYLDIHQAKLEEDRRSFETYRAQMEAELESERAKLREHLKTLEAREHMNSDLLDTDRRKLIREKDALAREVETERHRLEEQRIEQARKIVELQQHNRRLQDQLLQFSAGGGAAPSAGNYTARRSGMMSPTPQSRAPPPSARRGSPSLATPHAPSFSTAAPTPRTVGPTSIKVYVNVATEINLLGEVTLTKGTSVGNLRNIIQSRFGLPKSYQMKRKKVPIRVAQDHHLAMDFFKSADDYIVVEY